MDQGWGTDSCGHREREACAATLVLRPRNASRNTAVGVVRPCPMPTKRRPFAVTVRERTRAAMMLRRWRTVQAGMKARGERDVATS